MFYKASLDIVGKIFTTIISLLFAFVIYTQVRILLKTNANSTIVIIVLLVIIYSTVLLFRPLGYSINKKEIIINRFVNKIYLPIISIKNIRLLLPTETKWMFRTFGVSGLFGYWGKFTNRSLGVTNWYSTKQKNLVLITMKNGRKVIISPNDYLNFIAAIHIAKTKFLNT